MITVAIARDLGPFDGPLDLLLALVRRNQYPLDALPIAEITGQYLTYIKDTSQADVELGGDFLETASWLVLLKSRAMLPQAPGEEAPSLELERALLDHETLRATAGLPRSRLDAAGLGPGSGMTASEPGLPVPAEVPDDERVRAQPTVADALLAARRALAVAGAHAAGHGRSMARVIRSLRFWPSSTGGSRPSSRGVGSRRKDGLRNWQHPKPESRSCWRCWSWPGCSESCSGSGRSLVLSC